MSDDMETALTKLYNKKIIDLEMFNFLNEYRRYRNRIVRVYKQPTVEQIIEFIEENKDKIQGMVNEMTNMYRKL